MKQLPNNKELENSLLSVLINHPDYLELWFEEGGQIEHFYNSSPTIIIKTLYQMMIEGLNVDLVSLKSFLEKQNKLEKVGGQLGLMELMEGEGSFGSWKTYAKQLEDLYKQREIIKTTRQLESKAFEGNSLEDGVEKAMSSFASLLREGKTESTKMEDNISLLEKYIEENKNKDLLGYSWGIDWLNKQTKGIQKAKTYRIGAKSGVGKTNLIYQLIPNLLKQGVKVMFISLENTIEGTYIKTLSSLQGVNPDDIEAGVVAPNYEWLKENKENFILTDQLLELGKIKREVLKIKPDVVILDYIGQVSIKGVGKKERFEEYALQIKEFVQQNQWLSWIDLSNMKKEDTEEMVRANPGFIGSGELINAVDFALHLFHYSPYYEYKDDMYKNAEKSAYQKIRNTGVLTFLCTKNRFGNPFEEDQFVLNFDKGIRYEIATKERKEQWKALGINI